MSSVLLCQKYLYEISANLSVPEFICDGGSPDCANGWDESEIHAAAPCPICSSGYVECGDSGECVDLGDHIFEVLLLCN